MKSKTTTEVVTKTLARSGPDLQPNQIRLADEAQTDKTKVFTQTDVNQGMAGGGGGGGSIDPEQLNSLATKEELENEATLRNTGDKANLGLIESNKRDISAISNDYTTTDEYNGLIARVGGNEKDIDDLQTGFDAALLAAKEGAENIEIEFQSTAKKADVYTKTETDATFAKKEDLPEGADLSGYAKTDYVDSADNALNDLIATETQARKDGDTAASYQLQQAEKGLDAKIAANTEAIAAIEIPEAAGPDSRLPYRLGTDKAARAGLASIELVDAEDNYSNVKFHGLGGVVCTSTIEGINVDGQGITDAFSLSVDESDDGQFEVGGDQQKQTDAEAGTVTVSPSIRLTSNDLGLGRVWFQGGGGTGVSLDGAVIKFTTTTLNNRSKSNESRLNKITPEGDDLGRVQARAGAGTAAFTVKNASEDNAETMTVSGSGDVVARSVQAGSFEGDGSKLTGLPSPTYVDWSSLPNLTV